MEQKYSSACTDVNCKTLTVPSLFTKQEKYCLFKTGDRVVDLGSGRETTHISRYLRGWDVSYAPYDKYNQLSETNQETLNKAPYTVATLSNVLNVIAEPEIRSELLQQAWDLLGEEGWIYITVYEGNKSGKITANEKQQSCQLNRKLKDYLPEICAFVENQGQTKNTICIKHEVIMIQKGGQIQ